MLKPPLARLPKMPPSDRASIEASRATGRPRSRGVDVLTWLLLAGVYFLAGKFGLSLALVHPNATPVWAASGIAIAAVLRLGYRVWPAIFVAAFLVNATTAGSIFTSLGIASGNTLEALAAAYLVRRFVRRANPFDRAPDTFRFAILAGMVSTAISASIGVTSLTVGGFAQWSEFGAIWATWWMGDMGGALVVAPLLILWSERLPLSWTRAQMVEAALLLTSIVIVGLAVFGGPLSGGASGNPLAFLCMPLLVWAAFRFDPRIASATIFALSAVAVVGLLRGTPPAQRWEQNLSLITVQVFMGVAAVTSLSLAAVVAERRRVEAAVRATSEELRGAMTELEAFSHSISHDLRSPVGAVLNYSAVIEEDFGGRLDEEGIRLLRRIRSSAESAACLLDQLVQFGWVEREKENQGQVDMGSLAKEVHAEVVAGGDGAADVRFTLGELPATWGSDALLRCVFRNLFGNAVKYTRGRDVRHVRVGGSAGERENTYFVADNGIGFDPQLAEAVFQPFRRLVDSREYEGSGLGLAIVARIIRDHHGRIWAESDGETGARFTFTLPNPVKGS